MQNKEPAIDQSKCRICDSYELNSSSTGADPAISDGWFVKYCARKARGNL